MKTTTWPHRAVAALAAIGALSALLSLAAVPADAAAQGFPSKPIRMIVPFSVGGPTDSMARDLAKRMSDDLGQTIVVENRPGSGGNIGAELVARSAADGYTLLFGSNGPLAGNASLYKGMNYDPVRSFTPITAYAAIGNILAVHPSFPARSLAELVQLIKEQPGRYSYASGGNGTTPHFSGELLKTMAGLEMTHIPYKGESAAMTDVLGGQVPMIFCSFSSCLQHVRSGRLNALAVTTPARNPALPDVPALAETLPGYDIRAWFGLVAPAGTPADVVEKLNAAAVKAIRSEAVAARISGYGGEAMAGTPQAFGRFIQAEAGRWAQVVKAAGATID
ncbi:MAG: tripartite tricarboxylate transporter substrate binding protein [Burkholderiaceae bacterium]